jgi:hypothetical protein
MQPYETDYIKTPNHNRSDSAPFQHSLTYLGDKHQIFTYPPESEDLLFRSLEDMFEKLWENEPFGGS